TAAERAAAGQAAAERIAAEKTAAEGAAIVVVNPNNPDGRLIGRERLLRLHDLVAERDGVLVVDEAVGEGAPEGRVASTAGGGSGGGVPGERGAPRMLVVRSFGKFYGLAGVRLGFVVGAPALLARLRAAIGDWPVSVDAMVAGLAAYADHGWAERTRV